MNTEGQNECVEKSGNRTSLESFLDHLAHEIGIFTEDCLNKMVTTLNNQDQKESINSYNPSIIRKLVFELKLLEINKNFPDSKLKMSNPEFYVANQFNWKSFQDRYHHYSALMNSICSSEKSDPYLKSLFAIGFEEENPND